MKPIKFDLPINGTKVRSLEELRDNFTTEILELHASGVLSKWLKSRGLEAEVEKLSAMSADLGDVDRLVGLCEILGVDADRAVIEVALSDEREHQGVPLHADPDELKYKEKYERLSGLMEELKRKRLYLTQDDYNRFVKDKIQIEHEGEIECVTISKECYEGGVFDFFPRKNSPRGKAPLIAFSFGPRLWKFQSKKKLGDVIEAGELIGILYEAGDSIKNIQGQIKSPVRGILAEWSENIQKACEYKKGDSICYIRINHETDPTIKIISD